jgi:hypothetical protein
MRVRVLAMVLCVMAGATGVALAQTPPITYYLSEGATGWFFDQDILIANPNNATAPVTLTFSKENGEQVVATRSLPPWSRVTVHVDAIPGLEATSASAQVRSDSGLPLVVERSMFWDKTYYAGHTGSSVDTPAKDWFFAEGSQGFFSTFVLVINPNPTPIDVTFTFLREFEPSFVKTVTVPANTRSTLYAGDVPELVNRSFGISVHATLPIMAERSMYFGSTPTRIWSGGTESAGVTSASKHWFLAEGATGGFFDTFILLSNPQTRAAAVTLTYLLDNGQTVIVPKTIPANTRLTTNIETEPDARLQQGAMSTVVTSDVPIIAERSMYWKGAAFPWGEGHNSFGVVNAGTLWGLAEGRTGGPLNFHTYILLANPQTSAANVTVSFLRESGAPVVKTFSVPATSRFNIDIGSITELRDESFGAVISSTNDVPIIVERSMYWDSNGFMFSGGTNATGIALAGIVGPPGQGGDGGGDGGGGGGGGGGGAGSNSCTSWTSTAYPGFTYHLPAARPFISLDDYAHAPTNSTPYTRFKRMIDNAVAGHPAYGYSAVHSVIGFRLTGQPQYIQDAITRVEQDVAAAEADIAAGRVPAIAGDSYLDVGNLIAELALTYDYGFDRLTASQRDRWARYADQAIFNVWHPNQAAWGGVKHTWSGWSICDPGNNYHYSFLRATMFWALAKQDQALLNFLQTQKFPPLIDYFAALPGGGTREGTGYGTALNNLFENEIIWKASTSENLAGLSPHVRDTIDYWVHATVPTLDRFAPIGDLSRESIPNIYDYQENLVHEAVVLSAGTDQAKRGVWWLQNNSINGVSSEFNLQGDLLPYPNAAVAPTATVYHATGAGMLFARSGWQTTASWLAVQAGKYDQSHAHHDEGGFTFFKNDWLTVTSNIWSHSGIHQEDEAHNVLRFTTSGGSTIEQNASDTVQSTMTYVQTGAGVSIAANLTNAYSGHRSQVQSWTRTFDFNGDVVRVHDVCAVGAGVKPTFQLHVPTLPAVQGDGSIVAGHLRVVPLLPVHTNIVAMHAVDADFNSGYRIDLTIDAGCEFNVELRYQ